MTNSVNSFIICDNVDYSKVHLNQVNHIKYALLSSLDDNIQECEIIDMDETRLDGLTLALGEKKIITGATGASIGRNDFPMYKVKNKVTKQEAKKSLDKLSKMKDIIWDGNADSNTTENARRSIYSSVMRELTKLISSPSFNYNLSATRSWDKSVVLFNIPDKGKEEIEHSLQDTIEKVERIKKLGSFILNYQYLQGKRSNPKSKKEGEPALLPHFKKALEEELLKKYNGPDHEDIKADHVRTSKNSLIMGYSNRLETVQMEKLANIALEELEKEVEEGQYGEAEVEELYERLKKDKNSMKKILLSSEEKNPEEYDIVLRVDSTLNYKMSEDTINKYSDIKDVYEFALNLIKIRNLFVDDDTSMMKEFDYFRNKILKYTKLSDLYELLLNPSKESSDPLDILEEEDIESAKEPQEDPKGAMAEITGEIPKNISDFYSIFKKQ